MQVIHWQRLVLEDVHMVDIVSSSYSETTSLRGLQCKVLPLTIRGSRRRLVQVILSRGPVEPE